MRSAPENQYCFQALGEHGYGACADDMVAVAAWIERADDAAIVNWASAMRNTSEAAARVLDPQDLSTRYGTIAEGADGNLCISPAPDASGGGCQRFLVAAMAFSRPVDSSHVYLGPPGAGFGGTVDSHFRGLTPLSNLEGPMIDIAAVTGLAGHVFGPWRWRGKLADHAAPPSEGYEG